MTKATIGIIGVGLMGRGIATNVQMGGWPLGFLAHPGNQDTTQLVAGGAAVFQTGQALAAASDTVIICVTGSPQVEDVLTRPDGVLAGLRPGSTVIDCSTAIPSATQRLAGLVVATGGRFLDAPMTRTPKEAAEGRLNLIVGGAEADFAAQLPLLQSFAENITRVGPVGAGHTMKLLHNFVSLGFASVLAEAAAAARQTGVAPEAFHDVLANGGGAGVVLDRMGPYIRNGDTSSFRFTLSNSAKDIGYHAAMCGDLGAERTVAEAVAAMLRRQVDAGHGEKLFPELVDLLAAGAAPEA